MFLICGHGGIGRRAGFRFQWFIPCRFKSCCPHHLLSAISALPQGAVLIRGSFFAIFFLLIRWPITKMVVGQTLVGQRGIFSDFRGYGGQNFRYSRPRAGSDYSDFCHPKPSPVTKSFLIRGRGRITAIFVILSLVW